MTGPVHSEPLFLSAREAASELSISAATLYAYVSRGLIRSEAEANSRRKRYRADDVRAAWPNIRHWVIAGHSMGGAMAGYYAFHHQKDLAGLIIWDSYPPEQDSLADSDLPVWHIHRATLAGAPPEKFEEMRHLFPASSTWVPVPGGIHMYFGSFDGGGYKEQWTPKISREAQQDIVVTAMLNALQKIAASGR